MDTTFASAAADIPGGFACRICGCESGQKVIGREQFFGTGEEFEYFECGECGCVQIVDIPNDLSAYYPRDYYSLVAPERNARRRIKAFVIRVVIDVTSLTPILQLIRSRSTGIAFWVRLQALCRDKRARILDVGAGGGDFVQMLRMIGFDSASGVEPHLAEDRLEGGRMLVRKGDLSSIEGEWDLICFNDVLEHLADQEGTLSQARRLLAQGGRILVRVPVVGGEAWRLYGQHWAGFDAPRHLYLHSRRSLEVVAEQAGLTVESLEYDSTAFQFEGSEMIRAGLPLTAGRETMAEAFRQAGFAKRARALNRSGEGDHLAMVLRANR